MIDKSGTGNCQVCFSRVQTLYFCTLLKYSTRENRDGFISIVMSYGS